MAIDRQKIATQILAFLEREFPSEGRELTETTGLLDEWFVDSFGLIETVMFLESTFGIRVARADINGTNFQSVSALVDYVMRARPG